MALNLALNKDEERRFINVLKGLLAFLVLYGHVIQVFYTDSKGEFWLDPVFECIYSFHMPLFMLISGYLFSFYFKKRELKELI
ncbi:MAG: acyltransferase family protein, partial [Clostridia bacterium]|nr:acyltransferase family protein [Clostridia bacterium]